MKKLTFSELFAIGLGFTLGSAVFSLTGVAAMQTGSSTFLAYIVGAIAIFIMMLPVIIAGSVVPRQGVSYSLSKEALCHSMGGFYFWIFFIGRIAMFANITAFAIFVTSVFTTLDPKIVAAAAGIFFYITNYFGMKTAAKTGKIMNVVLLLGYAVFIIFGIINMDTTFVFNKEYFITHGAGGFFSAVSVLVFSMGGGMSMLEMGGSVEDPERNLPKACFCITLCAGLLYAGIALATCGALPYVDPADGGTTMAGTLLFNGPSNAVINASAAIFENMTPLHYFFIFGGACLAIATTINGSFGWYAAPVQAACADGWFPKWFAVPNKYGVPYRIQAIFLIAAIAMLFFFPSEEIGTWNTNILKASTNLQILVNIIPNFALIALPKLYPEAWEKSRWHMSKGMLHFTMWVPTLVSIYLWWLNFRGLTITIQYVLIALFVVGAVYAFIGGRTFAKPKKPDTAK
jgi:amino acid transporter